MEETFKDVDHLPRNEPLNEDESLLLNLLELEKEAAIQWIETLDEEEQVWIETKLTTTQKLSHEAIDLKKPKVVLPEAFQEYKIVFEKEASKQMPERKKWDHAIDLKPDFLPRDSHTYPLNPKEQGKLREFLDENLRKGYIRPSKSPQASTFFFMSKKEDPEKLRPCQDYRQLNEGTIKNTYPLPRISDLLDKLKGVKYFMKLDLRAGYNNV